MDMERQASSEPTQPRLQEHRQIEDLLGKVQKTQLKSKEKVLWDPNNPNSNFYFVLSGVLKLRVTKWGSRGLELLYPGALFGGITHHPGTDMYFEVTAIETSIVAVLSQQDLLERQSASPEFARWLMRAFSLYASSLRSEYCLLAECNLKARLARALYRDFEARGRISDGQFRVSKIMSQEEWALLLRARRETVSRAFSELERSGILREADRSLILENKKELLRIVSESTQ